MTPGSARTVTLLLSSLMLAFLQAPESQRDMPAATRKSTKKAQPTPSSFVCPDLEAKKACESYQELLKARDSGLPNESYVCFRKTDDQFFVVGLDISAASAYALSRETEAFGLLSSYKDGVDNPSIQPNGGFSGKWKDFGWGPRFSAEPILDSNAQPIRDANWVTIDSEQIAVSYVYKNTLKEDIGYSLTIQRSTGRFSEEFRQGGVPISPAATGRCIYRKGK